MDNIKLKKLVIEINKVIKSKSSKLSTKDFEILVTIREELKSTSNREGIANLLYKLVQLCVRVGLASTLVKIAKKYFSG